MFGKRNTAAVAVRPAEPAPAPEPTPKAAAATPKLAVAAPAKPAPDTDNRLNDIKVGVFNALLDAVDLKELVKLPPDTVREELTDIISEIVNIKKIVLSASEQQQLVG